MSADTDFIRSLMHEAGQELRRAALQRTSLRHKSKTSALDLVTESDFAVEALIRDALTRRFPDDHFWGEEAGMPADPAFGRVWICDPIDGTRSFFRFGVNYCVSLGLLVNGRVQQAHIYDPTVDDYYFAESGKGAWLNSEQLKLSPKADLSQALVGIGFSERSSASRHTRIVGRLLGQGAMLHQHGSGALSLAQVAAGRLEAYLELHLNAWDAVPGLLIAQEAGAIIRPWRDQDLTAGAPTLCANPGIYDQLDEILRDVRSSEPNEDTAEINLSF